ncbi:histone acetyltransferase [Photobacterium aquae]|uniref:Histone acetyltransferase n=1 Tax=Photobacterium aquae TaxID=1195763 RepID=A0A0J1GZC7_9GAMM|nr:GNAT family N-acetyltransferase [Photobacterium aquae]KLV04839.1 histone acetyltransferase [Photobacterium aquae]
MTITVRQVALEDAKGITSVLNPIITEGKYTILDTTYTPEEEKEFIANFPDRGVFSVAIEDGNVLGFQNVEPFADYTKAFDHVGVIATYVDSAARRKGVSKMLFAHTFRIAKEKGYRKLFAYVLGDNDRALAAYTKQGFEIVGIAKQHAKMGDRYVDETLIEKLL